MKLKKLNNKGMTIVEILVTFILLAIITISLYSSVSSYKNAQRQESYKEKIYTYKNLLTKEIQDDLIKDGLVSATTSMQEKGPNDVEYTVTMKLRSGVTKNLIIRRTLAASSFFAEGYNNITITRGDVNKDGVVDLTDLARINSCIGSGSCTDEEKLIADIDGHGELDTTDAQKIEAYLGGDDTINLGTVTISVKSEEEVKEEKDYKNDYFMITYDGIDHPLPNLGETTNDYGKIVKDLRINNIDINTNDNVLSIYIGFYHPDFGTRYGIDIACPINYLY